MKSNKNNIYKEIGKLTIENIDYPVFFNNEDGKTYCFRDGAYIFIDWNWTK